MKPIEHLPYARQLSIRLVEERQMHDSTLTRVGELESENNALRQLVKDLLAWTSEGFLLIGNTQKAEWEQRYEVLQNDVKDLLGEQV